jgi:putative acetyltransferase
VEPEQNINMHIAPAESAPDIDAVRDLWREYWDEQGFDPAFQNFTAELAALPGVYAPPSGALLLVRVDGTPAGTIALRPLSPTACEAKRLYVRPQFRRLKLGRTLLERIIETARTLGYSDLYGDTMPQLTTALQLYDRMGFERTGPFSANPTPGAVFVHLRLAIL